jgi:hypothetical protein
MRMPYIVVRTNAAIRRIAARPITSVADLDAIAEDARVALRAVPQARTEYATYWQTDPNLNETYYGPDPMLKKLNFWALDLGRWMHVVARRAHQFCREASPAGSSEEAWAAFRTKLLAIPYVDLAPHVETVERTSVCPVAPREIRVDGDLADWDGVPELAMERLRGWDRPPTPAAQTGRFRMAWDPRGLLIAAEIEGTGPALVAGDAEPPRGQGLRIAVNPHPEDLRQVDPAPHVTEIALCPRETGPVVWRLQAPGSKGPGVMAGVPFVARRFGNRTVYEALVPWKALGIARPAAGQVIGFAIAASDAWPMADSAYLGWGRGIQFAHDQRLYYPVTLGGEGGR